MTERRRHALPDAAQAANGRQKPSTLSMRPPVQPEAGTICAGSAFSSGGFWLVCNGGAYAHFRSLGGAYVHILKSIDENCAFVDRH